MQVIGFNFDKINAERKNPIKGKIQINSNIVIKNIVQEKVDIIKEKTPFRFNFEFTVKYEPDVAEIVFTGVVLVLLEKEESKDLIKKWKTKKLLEEVRVPIFNLILSKSNLRALQFEEEFNLPMHVPMPRVTPQQDSNQKYAG